MAIKVFEITADASLSGASRHIIFLSKALKRLDCEPIIISPKGWLVDEAQKEKTPYFVCEIKSIFDWSSFFKFRQLIKKNQPDIIHFHGTRAGIWGIWIRFFSKIPIIYSEHLYTKDYHLNNPIRGKLQLVVLFLVCFWTNKIVAPSKAVKLFLVKNLKINSKKIVVVNNGLELIKIIPIEVKELKIGFIGGLNEQKGLQYLIIAMHRLVARFPKLKLEIVGAGPLFKDLKKQSTELKNNIIFFGAQNNPQKYLIKWRLLVVPSISESFGQVALEAARAQKPVVASRVGGLSEVIIDKKTGLLVDPRNSNDLVKAISYLLWHSRVARLMGRRAKIRFERKFTAGMMAQRMNQVYQNVLEK